MFRNMEKKAWTDLASFTDKNYILSGSFKNHSKIVCIPMSTFKW